MGIEENPPRPRPEREGETKQLALLFLGHRFDFLHSPNKGSKVDCRSCFRSYDNFTPNTMDGFWDSHAHSSCSFWASALSILLSDGES